MLSLISYQGTCEYLLAGVNAHYSTAATNFHVHAMNDNVFNPERASVVMVARVRLVIGSNEVKVESDQRIPWIPVRLTVRFFA